jgi:hypothetical protein
MPSPRAVHLLLSRCSPFPPTRFAPDVHGFAALLNAAQEHLGDLVEEGPVTFGVSALVVHGHPHVN